MIPRLLLLVSVAILTFAAQGKPPAAPAAPPPPAAPAEPPPRKCLVEVQCVTMTQALALPIIRQFRSATAGDAEKAAAEVTTLLEKGTAILAGWPIVTTTTAQKATTEQTEELRYPTRFEAGTANVYLTEADGTVAKLPSRIRGTDLQPLATEFNSQALGITLEAEPTIASDGKTLDVAFIIQHVQLKSIDRWTLEHEFTTEKKTEKVIQEQPRFTTFKAQNVLTLKSGEYKLVGVFKTADAEPTLELFILRAEVLGSK